MISSRRIALREDLIRDWWSSPRALLRGQPKVAAKFLRLLVRSRRPGSEEDKWRRRAVGALVALGVTAVVAMSTLVLLQ